MSRFISADSPFFDNVSGAPVAFGTAYFGVAYNNPKTNPKVAYSNPGLTVALPASMQLTAAGKLPHDVWLSGDYSLTVDDSSGEQVFSHALVSGSGGGGGSVPVFGESSVRSSSYTLSGALHNVFAETSGGITITIPAESTSNLSLSDNMIYMHHVRHTGGGTLIIAGASGVTVRPPRGGALSLSEAGQTVTISKSTVAANSWLVYGQTDGE